MLGTSTPVENLDEVIVFDMNPVLFDEFLRAHEVDKATLRTSPHRTPTMIGDLVRKLGYEVKRIQVEDGDSFGISEDMGAWVIMPTMENPGFQFNVRPSAELSAFRFHFSESGPRSGGTFLKQGPGHSVQSYGNFGTFFSLVKEEGEEESLPDTAVQSF